MSVIVLESVENPCDGDSITIPAAFDVITVVSSPGQAEKSRPHAKMRRHCVNLCELLLIAVCTCRIKKNKRVSSKNKTNDARAT
jgi:hypothetical protein